MHRIDDKSRGDELMIGREREAETYLELCLFRFLKNCDSDSSAGFSNLSGIGILGGAATCSEGFVNCFLRVPQAVVGLYCSCHAAQASKGNF